MLPKSNQDQLYIWIDTPRWWWIEKTNEVRDYLDYLLLNTSSQIDENLRNQIEYTTSTVWQAYIWEFANLFRWWLNRTWENQISTRINLYSPDDFKNRLSSEEFTIKLRKQLEKELLYKFPDVKISLLEDPPWPPVRSTFLLMVKWDASKEDLKNFALKVKNEILKISWEQKLVDINDSFSTTYRKINLEFDHESISRAWLSITQVENTLWILLNWMDINVVNSTNQYEPTNILLTANKEQLIDINFLKSLSIK